MRDIEQLKKSLEQGGITLRYFDTAAQAADYLDGSIDSTTVAFGGSVTVKELELYPRLSAHNRCIWHWEGGDKTEAMNTDVYISSLNAIAATGELVNIDGTGNRVASTLFGHRRVVFVAGINKLVDDYDAAVWRARNLAAPPNAKRLACKTPCAVKGDRCYNCTSPQRVCRAMVTLWCRPFGIQEMELVLIGETLGM